MPTGKYIRKIENPEVRFWSKVNKNGSIPPHAPELGQCWEWLWGKHSSGHGHFYYLGKREYAHRVSWILNKGRIVNNLCVLHKCDNPGCVNPEHLFLGTQTDNMNDMWAKGRNNNPGMKGESHHMAKLTAEKVECIRQRYAQGGISMLNLGKQYGISRQQIGKIIKGESWKSHG